MSWAVRLIIRSLPELDRLVVVRNDRCEVEEEVRGQVPVPGRLAASGSDLDATADAERGELRACDGLT